MQQLPGANDAALAERLMEAAQLVVQLVRLEVRRRRPGGLSLSQVRTLSLLSHNPGASLADVAEHVGLGAPAASRLVDDLVRGGLVTREPGAADRRRIELRLLPAGRRALQATLSLARAPRVARLQGLEPEEKAQLSTGLELLRQALTADAGALETAGAGSQGTSVGGDVE